jgi:hypothetical protein
MLFSHGRKLPNAALINNAAGRGQPPQMPLDIYTLRQIEASSEEHILPRSMRTAAIANRRDGAASTRSSTWYPNTLSMGSDVAPTSSPGAELAVQDAIAVLRMFGNEVAERRT